jgi:hypothetical protein
MNTRRLAVRSSALLGLGVMNKKPRFDQPLAKPGNVKRPKAPKRGYEEMRCSIRRPRETKRGEIDSETMLSRGNV